jgi:hypothetical protein
VGIAVRDATDGRFVPAASVEVTLIDEGGRVIGAGEHSLVWDPLAHQYGRNWQVEFGGPYSMRVRLKPLTPAQAAEVSMPPIEVEFSDLNVTLGRPPPGPARVTALREQHQI